MDTKTDINRPDIYEYTDYREFLHDMYMFLKKRNSAFSYRYIAQHTGASSAGWLPNIIKGRISLTSSYRVKLQKLLGLTRRECEYFELLVDYNQAGTHEEKVLILERLKSIKGIQPALVRKEHLDYLTKWYISAIRELLLIYPFKGELQELSEMIIPRLSIDEVREAVEVLQKTCMVKTGFDGYIRPCDNVIMKDPSVKTDLWKTYMISKIKLGIEAIENFSKELRDISEVYMPLSKDGFEIAKEEISKLRKKLLVISDNDKKSDRVYQCTFQLFPLTEKMNKDT